MVESTNEKEAAAAPDPASLSARLLRELLKTPAFREACRISLKENAEPAAPEMVRTLMWTDFESSMSAAAILPRVVDYFAFAAAELGRQLSALPPELRNKFVRSLATDIKADFSRDVYSVWRPLLAELADGQPQWRAQTLGAVQAMVQFLAAAYLAELCAAEVAEQDGRALAEHINEMTRRLTEMYREQPELAKKFSPFVTGAVGAIDFGRLREGFAAATDFGGQMTSEALCAALRDPVAMANLLGMLPPALNSLLKVLTRVLATIDIAPEILASALFNTMAEIDQRELGRLLTLGARRINELHAGNFILGGTEPRFRRVLADFLLGLAETLDAQELRDSAVALSEDFETALQAVSDVLLHSPASAGLAASAAAAGTASLARATANIFERLAELPEDVFQQLMREWRKQASPLEAARLINALFSLADRIAADQDGRNSFASVWTAVDRTRVIRVVTKLAANAKDVVSESAPFQNATRPEELGRRVNNGLVALNRRLASSSNSVSDWCRKFWKEIDPVELEKALRLTFVVCTRAFFSTAGRGMALLRPLATAGRQAFSCWLSNLRHRLFGRRTKER